MRHILVLGDQLNPVYLSEALKATPETAKVLLIESREWASRKPYHAHKLVLVWSAMRHFAEELRDQGWQVDYTATEAPFFQMIQEILGRSGSATLEMVTPRDRRTREALYHALVAARIDVKFVPDPFWETAPMQFREWLQDHPHPKMEDYYRWVRRRTRILMTTDDKPVGGVWNYDKENRKPFPKKRQPVPPFRVEPDSITQAVQETVRGLPPVYGEPDGFYLPVTRHDALRALEYFISVLLPDFGPYEDAMSREDAFGYHSLLSPLLNLSLLSPRECITAAVAAYQLGQAPLNSVEGFIRQILGWREFMFHMYENFAGDYHTTNSLNHTHPLPTWYWTGETRMECLRTVIRRVLDHGYSHHIERLMVLGNFALLLGVNPHEINDWFWSLYVDAHQWVVTPNVVGMSQFADGGWIATKPYISTGAYIQRMSDYCGSCPYDPKQSVGPEACPFTTLYWSFLLEHEGEELSGRMTQNYFGLRNKDSEERQAILRHKVVLLKMVEDL